MKKTHFLIIFIILVAGVGVFFYMENLPGQNQQSESEKNQLNRQEIMKDMVGKIGRISPIEPVLGGNWYPIRFWFIQDSEENFYVEYEDGHILRQILLEAEKKENEINYKIIGYFEPGESGWILKSGKDEFFGAALELYEHDEESGLWVKKN